MIPVHPNAKTYDVSVTLQLAISSLVRKKGNLYIERCRKKASLSERMDQSILKWYGHAERMEDDRLVRKVYELEMQGPKCKEGLVRDGWMV